MKNAKKRLSAILAVVLAISCCMSTLPVAYAATSAPQTKVAGDPNDVAIYPTTPNAAKADSYTMTVNGKEVFIEDFYDASQARLMHNGKGPLDVVVTVKAGTLTTCDVYPRRAEVYPAVDAAAKTISFTITPEMLVDSMQYVVVIPGLENIILMVDPPEEDKPSPDDANVYNVMDQAGVSNDGTKCTAAIQAAIDKVGEDPNLDTLYFPDGLYVTGRLEIKHDNVAIYLSSGTLIKGASDAANTTELALDYPFGETGFGHNDRRNGSVFIQPMGKRTMVGTGETAHYEVEPIKNFKLYGRGVIDGSGREIYTKVGSGNDNQANWIHLFEAKDVDGLVVKDVIMRNSSNWCFKLENVNNAQVTNAKVINSTTQRYADGMDLSSVTNATYTNNLSYSQDDAIAIMTLQLKNETNTGYAGPPQGPTENITFKSHFGYTNCSAVRIGWDSTDEMNNLTFDGCEWAKYDAGGFNIHRLQYNNKYGPITFKDCRWDNADNKGMKTFATCYGVDGNGFSSGQINAEEIKFENCVIDGMYQGAFNIQGNTIDKVIFDSTRISNGTPTGLVTKKEEIPHLITSGTTFEFSDTYGLAGDVQPGRYEAEAMPLSGYANLSTNTPGYSGFGFARNLNVVGSGAKLNFNAEKAGNYDFTFRYSSTAGLNNMELLVNGEKIKNVYFKSTDEFADWADHVETVALNEGANTVELKAASTKDDSIYLDYVDVSESEADAEIPPQDVILNDTLEAEAAPVITGGKIISDAKASQTKAVEFFAVNDSIQYGALQSEAERLILRYKAAQDTTLGLYNEDEKVTSVFLPATAGDWSEVSVNESFAKDFTLKLRKENKDANAVVDYVVFETGAPATNNLAKYSKVTTNTSIQSDHYRWYGVRNAVDGKFNDGFYFGCYGSGSAAKPQELLIDLEQLADVYEVSLYNANGATLEVFMGDDPDNLVKVADAKSYGSGRQSIVFRNGQELPIHARYVKISCVSGTLRMDEVEVMGVKTGDAAGPDTNVAKFKPVTQTVPPSQNPGVDGYSALNDGSDGGEYRAYVMEARPVVIEYDLLQEYTLEAFTNYISTHGGNCSADIMVEVKQEGSDDWAVAYARKSTDFTNPSNTHNAMSWPTRVDFDRSMVGRYVRLTCYTSTYYNQFSSYELEINGSLVKTTGVAITRPEVTLEPGTTEQLSAVISPAEANNRKLAWFSSDNSVATVDEKGLVSAVGLGTATITVRTLDGGFTDTCTVEVAGEITITPIESVEELDPINVLVGTAVKDLPLPKTVEVTLEGGKTQILNVAWDTGSYDADRPGTYTLEGEIQLVLTISNPSSIKATMEVTVYEKDKKAITSVAALPDITVAAGTPFDKLALPKTVEVTLEDGSKLDLDVTWDESGYSGAVGSNAVTGVIALTEQEQYKVTNPSGLKAQVTVIVSGKISKNLALDAEWELLNGSVEWDSASKDVAKAHDDNLGTGMVLGYSPDNPKWQASPDNPHKLLIKLTDDSVISEIITYRSDANDYTMDISVGMSPDSLEKISTQKTYKGSNGANTPVPVILDEGKHYPAKARYVQIEVTKTGDNSTKFSEVQIMGSKAEAEILGTLEPKLSAGDGKVTLAAMEDAAMAYFYKKTDATDEANKPNLDDTDLTGWTAFTENTDITGTNGTAMFVQVIGVKDGKIKAWGEASATPKEPVYKVNIIGGEGSGNYRVGSTVTIKATIPEGKAFWFWATGWATLDDPNAETTTFVMPDHDVSIMAQFKDVITYKATVENGTGTGDYEEGAAVSIKATVPQGKVFDKWVSSDGVVFANANAAETSFTMLGKAVTVTATFKNAKYTATVENGTGTGDYEEGATVSIKATIPQGKVFDKWVSSDGVVFANANAAETSFTMLGKAVTVTATFKNAKYTATVENGTGTGDYEEGATVSIKATVPQGKVFDKWVSSDGVVFANANAAETSFTMLGKAVTVTATFKDEVVEVPVKKDDLQNLYGKYKDMKQGDYTDLTWDAFEKALAEAKAALGAEDATQKRVDDAVAALQAAFDGLATKPNQPDVPKTGDSSTALVIIFLSLASMSAAIFLYRKKKITD